MTGGERIIQGLEEALEHARGEADLEVIRARLEATTPGHWSVIKSPWGNGTLIRTGYGDPHGQKLICDVDPALADDDDKVEEYHENAEFIATARQDVKTLLDLLEEQRKEITSLKAKLPYAGDFVPKPIFESMARSRAEIRCRIAEEFGEEEAAKYDRSV